MAVSKKNIKGETGSLKAGQGDRIAGEGRHWEDEDSFMLTEKSLVQSGEETGRSEKLQAKPKPNKATNRKVGSVKRGGKRREDADRRSFNAARANQTRSRKQTFGGEVGIERAKGK